MVSRPITAAVGVGGEVKLPCVTSLRAQLLNSVKSGFCVKPLKVFFCLEEMHFHHFVCVQNHLNIYIFFQFQVFFLNHLNLLFQELDHFHQGAASWALDSGSVSVGQRSGITAAVHHGSPVRCWLALWAPGSVMDLTASNATAEPLFSRPQSQHLPREGHHEGS